MSEIKLTQNKIAIVSPEDYGRVLLYKWHYKKDKTTGYAATKINNKLVRLHNFIMNPPTGFVVDHKNHNGLDNQRNNLRVCTQIENLRNYQKPKNNKSGYKGVYFNKNAGKFCAKIRQGNKQKHLGLFTDAIKAARAYDTAAKTLFGEYALLNFSDI